MQSSFLGAVFRKVDRGTILMGIVTCGFFILYYLYVRWCLDPRLFYHANDIAMPSGHSMSFPIFFRGAAFFREFLSRPGGLTEYIAARCCQYYYYAQLGSLILTAIALMAYFSGSLLTKVTGGTGNRSWRLVPPLLLLIVYGRYTFHLESCIALVAALFAANFYMVVAVRAARPAVRFVVFAVASISLYYAAGGSFILFAVLSALRELLTGRRCLLGGFYLLAAAGLPLLGKCFFGTTLADAYFRPCGVFPFEETITATALLGLYLFFVLAAIVSPSRQRLKRLGSAVASRTGIVGKYCLGEKATAVYVFGVLVAAGALVALYAPDKDARRVLRANCLARMEMWSELLEEVDRYPSREYPASVMLDVNRALFETGQLGSRMFSYRQHPSVLFATGAESVSYRGGGEVLLRLGRINEAEHAALEALEIKGERPETLRQLAVIYIVKRQPEAARVFLHVLSKDIVGGQWAQDCLRRLDDDPLLSSDEQIRHLRSIMPQCDMVVTSPKVKDGPVVAMRAKEALLLALLARNRKNRMAFEYLMAYYLLTKQPGKIASNIGRLDDFDCPVVPDHYAEAILLYGHNVRHPIDLGVRTIKEHTAEMTRRVIEIARDCKGDNEAIAEAVAARFPDSYCRYVVADNPGEAR